MTFFKNFERDGKELVIRNFLALIFAMFQVLKQI